MFLRGEIESFDINKEFPWYFDRSGGFGDF